MSMHSAEEVTKHVRIYIAVFASLLVLTIATVAASSLVVSIEVGVLIALVIASIKGSLVASFFMHLSAERKIIYMVLLLSAVFFAFLMILPTLDVSNNAIIPGVGDA
jgi:cytochrome c oxidase subunit IV